jgi:diguanylate cyclase (GGDEF)-like protein
MPWHSRPTVLLPDTPVEGARDVACGILADLNALKLEHKASRVRPWVTVSIGVSCILLQDDTRQDELVGRADRALYRAKTGGRDRLEVITSEEIAIG